MALIAGVLGRAGQRGQRRRLKEAENGVVTWENPSEVQNFIKLDAQAKANEEHKKNRALEERNSRGKKREGPVSEAQLEAFEYFQKKREEGRA